jgi:hypothetical protein
LVNRYVTGTSPFSSTGWTRAQQGLCRIRNPTLSAPAAFSFSHQNIQ